MVEPALAHVVSDKVEAAYWRGNLFEKRRELMDAWAPYCETLPSENIRPLMPANVREMAAG